jgi:dCTP deaminase
MSTLTRKEIRELLRLPFPDRLTVSPILSEIQFGDASLDLRIGNQFIIFRRHTQGLIDPFEQSRAALHRFQERRIIRFGDKFILHPGVLALGATFEYIQLPGNVEGQVEGRSSWARLGLQIATATCVEPGFSGVITLELANVGNMPLELCPGARMTQLILRTTASKVESAYTGDKKYKYPIGPQFSRLSEDEDARVFLSKNG